MSLFPSRFCRGNHSIYCELGEEGRVEAQMRNQPETRNSHGPLRSNIGLNFGSIHDFYSIIAAKGKLVAQEHLLLRGWVFQKRDLFCIFVPASHVLTAAHCLYSNCTHRDPPTSVIVGQVGDFLSLFFPFYLSRKARLVTLSLVD